MAGEGERGVAPQVVAGVLGNLEVRWSDTPVPAGHARQKAVLAVLLTDVNRVVSPDRLIDRVWGGQAPDRARSVLRTYVSNLRRALAPTGITITWRDTGYLLAVDSDRVDVYRFRGLLALARACGDPRRALALVDEALALWRGEPLAELDSEWARSVREHLHRERAAARADRVDWALACGRHGEVLPELSARGPRTRGMSAWPARWCWRCTGPGGRPRRWSITSAPGSGWPRNWAPTPGPPYSSCTSACSPPTPL